MSKPFVVLYMIGHGPDATYLERLLVQVEPLVDGIAFVNTDETNDCIDVIIDSKIKFRDWVRHTYEDRKNFNFAECRNKALMLAIDMIEYSGPSDKQNAFVMWLDCDDTITPESVQTLIRHVTDNPDAGGFVLPYEVNAQNDNIRKIRLHRATEWQWINKVHEELRFTCSNKPELVVLNDCTVKHAPDEGKTNHQFHIDLLKEGCRNAPNEYAYIGKEYFNQGMFNEALPWLLKTAVIHDWANEKYIAWLYAGYIMLNHKKDTAKAEEYFRNATAAKPNRREAWFFLAQICVREGGKRLREGLAYIAACNAQIDENEPMQNQLIYGRDCYLLHAELLVAAKLINQAKQCLQKVLPELRNEAWTELAQLTGLTATN